VVDIQSPPKEIDSTHPQSSPSSSLGRPVLRLPDLLHHLLIVLVERDSPAVIVIEALPSGNILRMQAGVIHQVLPHVPVELCLADLLATVGIGHEEGDGVDLGGDAVVPCDDGVFHRAYDPGALLVEFLQRTHLLPVELDERRALLRVFLLQRVRRTPRVDLGAKEPAKGGAGRDLQQVVPPRHGRPREATTVTLVEVISHAVVVRSVVVVLASLVPVALVGVVRGQ